MIHIVFNEADISVLQQAIALDATLDGDIIQVKDDYAVGPVDNIHLKEGREIRQGWWANALQDSDFEHLVNDESIDDLGTVAQIAGRLRRDADEVVWIWAAQNKHDVSGYYWLLRFLREFQGRIFILYLNNLPFISEKGGIFYPKWLHEIPAREFLKAKKLAREITASEFEIDTDEWQKIASQNKHVRLLEGGKKLIQHEVTYYDAALLKYVSGNWQKASKVLNQFFNKETETTGDAFLAWRLRELVNEGKVISRGASTRLKEFEVALPGTAENIPLEEQTGEAKA